VSGGWRRQGGIGVLRLGLLAVVLQTEIHITGLVIMGIARYRAQMLYALTHERDSGRDLCVH
jgi:hypothetical protein